MALNNENNCSRFYDDVYTFIYRTLNPFRFQWGGAKEKKAIEIRKRKKKILNHFNFFFLLNELLTQFRICSILFFRKSFKIALNFLFFLFPLSFIKTKIFHLLFFLILHICVLIHSCPLCWLRFPFVFLSFSHFYLLFLISIAIVVWIARFSTNKIYKCCLHSVSVSLLWLWLAVLHCVE